MRKIDNQAVREEQITKLKACKAARDNAAVEKALAAIGDAMAKGGVGDGGWHPGKRNLLALSIDAARARATLGEISMAIEKVCGRHVASDQLLKGVYAKEYAGEDGGINATLHEVKEKVESFEKVEGRRPRMLVAKMGQDGHDRGAKVVSTGFADLGFDIDVSPLFQTPAEVARAAVDSDVHVVGVSSQAAGHRTLVPKLIAELSAAGAGDVMVIAGGVIPQQDHRELYEAGVACIFGPGTPIPFAANELMDKMLVRQQAAGLDSSR